jgi:hypothetical protein
MSAEANAAGYPCGHMCACIECLERVYDCPVCGLYHFTKKPPEERN